MDIERYRKRVEAELEKAAPANQRARRKARTQPAGEPTSPDVREAALTTAPLPEEDLTERVAALLSLLLDRKAPVAERAAALQALGALDFLGPRFEPYRADYKQALRQLATDPRATLREKALELLAIGKDPYAQDLLVKSLENPEEAVVSEAKAMQLLAYDDHAELTPLAQKVYKRSTGAAREEALRMLATDPSSERLLTRLLKDKSETSSIRRISASGLQSLNPAAFEKTARTDRDRRRRLRRDPRHQPRRPRARPRGTREARGPEVRRGRAASLETDQVDGIALVKQALPPRQRDMTAPTVRERWADPVARIETARQRPDAGRRLLELLPERSPLYAGRGTNDAERLRGYLLASFENVGLPPEAVPFVLEELETGRHPYAVAGAARALRGATRCRAEAPSLLVGAIARLRGNDDVVSFDDFAPEAAIEGSVTALCELATTLSLLGPQAKAALPTLKSARRRRRPTLLALGSRRARRGARIARPPGDRGRAAAAPHRSQSSRRRPCRCARRAPQPQLATLLLENQDGERLSFAEAFSSRPTALAFFYTRCTNPEKCSLTVTRLARLAQRLAADKLDANVAGISYDPGWDNPARLRRYGSRPWHALLAAMPPPPHGRRRSIRSSRHSSSASGSVR